MAFTSKSQNGGRTCDIVNVSPQGGEKRLERRNPPPPGTATLGGVHGRTVDCNLFEFLALIEHGPRFPSILESSYH